MAATGLRKGTGPRPGACPPGAAGLPRTAAIAVLLLATVVAGPAASQSPSPGSPAAPPAPGAVIPPGGTPVPTLEPDAPPPVGPGAATPAPVAPAAGVSGSVAVRGVRVEGATAFPAAELLDLAGPVVGPSVPLASVEAGRAAILNRYRQAGYVFTAVDAVLGADGVLRLVVAEGHVTEVLLDGDIGPAGTQVLRFLRNLVDDGPLNAAALERWLLLANDIPGVSVRSILRPAGTAPGALTLVAQVARTAVSGFVTGDNRGFRGTGPQQFLAVGGLNSFTSLGERTELALFYAAGYTQRFAQISTEFFVGGSGTKVRLYAGHGRATPSDALRALGYEGTSTIGGVAVSYPLVRQRTRSLVLLGDLDVIESEIETDDDLGRPRRDSRDALRVLRAGADGALFDLLLGEERPASNSLTVRVSRGLDVFGATGGSDAFAGRAGSDTGFTKVAFEAGRFQTLFYPWDGASVGAQLTLAGQYSGDVLPQAEKFYLGGARLGRGFYAGEVTGDSALIGSAELQLSTSLERTVLGRSFRLDPTAYAFYDHGRTWESTDRDPDRRLRSAGVGLRLAVDQRAEFQLEGVRRFTRRPGGEGVSEQKAEALFWRFLVRF